MAKPDKLRELRLVQTATFNTAHVNANNAGWAISNAPNMRIQSWDAGDLKHEGAPDGTLQTRLHAMPHAIATLRKGGVKFKTYAPTANSATTTDPISNTLGAILGAVQAPAARTIIVSTGSNTTHINFQTAHAMANGQAYLCGTRGDSRGGGEVRSQLSSVNANTVVLNMALSAAPSNGDVFVCSTTVYPDEDATQLYIDGLAVGLDSADALQFVGAMGSCKLSGTAPGELPSLEFDLQVADWREQQGVTVTTTTAPAGNKPPVDRALGGFFMADASTGVANWAPRTLMKVGEIDVDPGITYEVIPGPNGVNGIEGWQRMPSAPKLKFTALVGEDMPGLHDDFVNKQAKQVIAQFGHAAQACMAVEFTQYMQDQSPTRKALGNLAGIASEGHGEENVITQTDLTRAGVRFHVF